MMRAKQHGSISDAQVFSGQKRMHRHEQLRAERKRLVLLGMMAGRPRADEKERSLYLNRRIREASGLED